MIVNPRRWLKPMPRVPRVPAGRVMLCFPYGGGSPAYFQYLGGLSRHGVELWAVKLPGREERIAEPLPTLLEPVVEAIIEELLALGRPFLFHGHSFGAGLALEVAHGLAARGAPLPSKLILSGRAPPHAGDSSVLLDMSDGALWDYVRSQSLIPLPESTSEFARDSLAKLRSDLRLNAQLTYRFIEALPVPLCVVNGLDDPLIDHRHLEEWRRYTSSRFSSHLVPGGHFFFDSDPDRSYSIISAFVAAGGV